MVLGPFFEEPILLILHAATGMTLLLHWALNNDTCCLTTLESYLRGIPAGSSISGQFIQPLYNIPKGDWNTCIKIFTTFLVLISLSKLISNDLFRKLFVSSNFSEFETNFKNLVK